MSGVGDRSLSFIREKDITRIAFHQLESGDSHSALSSFEEFLSTNPYNQPALIGKARCLLLEQRPAEAIDALNKLVDPESMESVDVLLLKSDAFLRLGDYASASAVIDTVLVKDSDSLKALCQRCIVLLSSKSVEEGLGAAEDLVRRFSGYAESWKTLGIVYMELHMFDRALANFVESVDLSESDASVWHSMGRCHLELGELDEAIECLETALKLLPEKHISSISIHEDKGEALFRSKRYDASLEEYQICMSLHCELESVWHPMSVILVELGRFDEAISLLEEVGSKCSSSSLYCSAFGKVYEKMKKDEDAEIWFGRAAHTAPNDASLWFDLGCTQSRLGKYRMANESFHNALRENERVKHAWFAIEPCLVENEIGMTCLRVGHLSDAKDWFEKAVQSSAKFASGWVNLSLTLYLLDEKKESLSILEDITGLAERNEFATEINSEDMGRAWFIRALLVWDLYEDFHDADLFSTNAMRYEGFPIDVYVLRCDIILSRIHGSWNEKENRMLEIAEEGLLKCFEGNSSPSLSSSSSSLPFIVFSESILWQRIALMQTITKKWDHCLESLSHAEDALHQEITQLDQ